MSGRSQRSKGPDRRTTIEPEHLRLLGIRIDSALKEEHVRYTGDRRIVKRFSTERACKATGIPSDTMNAYREGKRQPSILDLRDISDFCAVTMNELMAVVPPRKVLDQQWQDKRRTSALQEGDDEW